MNAPQNNESRKHALITPEQEALLRLFEAVKKIPYGELNLFLQAGNIVRAETKKSKSFYEKNKTNVQIINEVIEDMKDFEVIAI